MAANQTDAQVEVSIGGVDKIVQAAQKAGDAWRKFGTDFTQGMQSSEKAGKAFAQAIKSGAGELLNLATQYGRIDWRAGIESSRRYGMEVNRFAISAGRDIASVRDQITATARTHLLSDDEALRVTRTVRSLTYDAGFAAKSVGAIADEANALDTSTDEIAGAVSELHNMYKGADDATAALAGLRGVVESIKPPGGMKETLELLRALGPAAKESSVSVRSAGAQAAEFGKSYTPAQREGQFAGVVGNLKNNRRWWEQWTGSKRNAFLNDRGEFDEEKAMAAVKGKFGRMSNKQALEVARWQFGDMAGTMFVNDFDLAKAKRTVATAPASQAAPRATAELMGTSEAQVTLAKQNAERSNRVAGSKWNQLTGGVQEWASEHPYLTSAGAFLATKALPFIPGAPQVVGAAAAGYATGTALDRNLGISDKIVNWLSGGTVKERDDAAFAEDRKWDKATAGATWKQATPIEYQQSPAGAAVAERDAAAITKAFHGVTLQAIVQQNHDGTVTGVKIGKGSAAKQGV